MEQYVIGLDFGTDSVRAVAVNAADGRVVSGGACRYPRWQQGLYQHPERDIFRQHPLDFVDAMEQCVRQAVSGLSEAQRAAIVGIGVDTTGSTPAPVDAAGMPLALKPEYAQDENAMFWLWKDHSSGVEAEEIEAAFSGNGKEDYGRFQGRYCSEWYWAKILRAARIAPQMCEEAYAWTEHCDWITGLLCGNTCPDTMVRSACAAGHKALWHSAWGGLPADDVLKKLHPHLLKVKRRFASGPKHAGICAGRLTAEWAHRLNLPEGIAVSGSSFDAHAGAVGAGIRPGTMVCTIGTSAADMAVESAEAMAGKDIRRFGGQAENSILPGLTGVETGQAAFGDIFAWFQRMLLWSVEQTAELLPPEQYAALRARMEDTLLTRLEQQALTLPEESFPIMLDWFNGRRYPDTDDSAKAAADGLSLGVTAPVLYRSLVFAAVCGLKRIMDGLESGGIGIEQVRAVGGISKKSELVMQMMADVLNRRIVTLDADQTCALGAAIYAATAAGLYETMQAACTHMAAKPVRIFCPQLEKTAFYSQKYSEYLHLCEKMC